MCFDFVQGKACALVAANGPVANSTITAAIAGWYLQRVSLIYSINYGEAFANANPTLELGFIYEIPETELDIALALGILYPYHLFLCLLHSPVVLSHSGTKDSDHEGMASIP